MTYKDLTKLTLPNLPKDTWITIIKQNDFGYPCSYQLKLDSIFFKDYAQYRNCIQIQGKRFKARKLSAILIRPYEDFAMYLGKVEVNDTTRVVSEDKTVKVISYGMCFDNNTLIKSLPENSILNSFEI